MNSLESLGSLKISLISSSLSVPLDQFGNHDQLLMISSSTAAYRQQLLTNSFAQQLPPTTITRLTTDTSYSTLTVSNETSIFTTINNKCGSFEAPTIMNNSENGLVSSPDFPSPYPNDAECVWHIKVSDGMIVMITFIEFEIEDE